MYDIIIMRIDNGFTKLWVGVGGRVEALSNSAKSVAINCHTTQRRALVLHSTHKTHINTICLILVDRDNNDTTCVRAIRDTVNTSYNILIDGGIAPMMKTTRKSRVSGPLGM